MQGRVGAHLAYAKLQLCGPTQEGFACHLSDLFYGTWENTWLAMFSGKSTCTRLEDLLQEEPQLHSACIAQNIPWVIKEDRGSWFLPGAYVLLTEECDRPATLFPPGFMHHMVIHTERALKEEQKPCTLEIGFFMATKNRSKDKKQN